MGATDGDGDTFADRPWLGRLVRFGPPATFGLIVAVGAWAVGTVERAERAELTDALRTTLAANVTAMTLWLDAQKAAVAVLAADPRVRAAVAELTGRRGPAGEDVAAADLTAHPAAGRLKDVLGPLAEETGHAGFAVVDRTGRVVAATADLGVGDRTLAERADAVGRALAGGPAVSRPFPAEVPVAAAAGPPRAGLPTMAVAAPVRAADGQPIAALVLRVRPESGFSRILQVARFGESGETYAVDGRGLMLSQSRFDDQLRAIGLVGPGAAERSMLGIQIRDPGGDLTAGFRTDVPRAEQPLTKMAAALAAGRDGVDVGGYRDYRGVPVVGAWQWLPDYHMGVTTEVDVAEAYGPLWALRRAMSALLGLLAASYAANVLSARAVAGLRRRARRVEVQARKAELQARQLGQYTLEEKIGEGGMGAVYKASHAMLRRPTAVKLLTSVRPNVRDLLRFEREVQLTSRLNHPNTITIFDFGRTPEGIFYYAMEYLPGVNLQRLVEDHGPLPDGRVIHVLVQVAAALREAHAVGLIHRDIKPANLMLCERGGVYDFVKVLDFGLVREANGSDPSLTAAGSIAGTPHYLAPEAIRDPQKADARSDLYAVGAVGYFLLTGRAVFTGPTSVDILTKHLTQPPDPPSTDGRPIAADLEAVILACLAKDPAGRPADAAALLAALRGCADFGTWANDDARAWWAAHDPAGRPLAALLPPAAGDPAFTIRIDLQERDAGVTVPDTR